MNAPVSASSVVLSSRRNRGRPLACFFTPGRIAVIGATERPGSVGRAVLENLQPFGGEVIPVNPARSRVLGLPAAPCIGEVKGPVDLAVIATPAATVPGLVAECAAAGVQGAIILSAGFGEFGAAGRQLQADVMAAARGVVRIVGPNCLGVMSPPTGLNATFAGAMARAGSVAFLSQSGALCAAILDWSLREKVGFSGFVSVGCMADVAWADLIDHFGDDPRTESLVIYLESIGDARSFLSAAREVAITKPIVVIKPGRTAAAARAAASHTGALTGSDEVLDAAFRRAGVLRVETIAEVFDLVEVLGKQPRPRGPRLTIVTNAGGPAALAADCAVTAGLKLAELSDKTLTSLGRHLPPHWSRGNPIDILGDADPDRYARALNAAAADPECDGVLAILTPQAMTDAAGVARRITGLCPLPGGKPLLASWMGAARIEEGEGILNAAGVPTFRYPDRAVRAFAHMWRYSANLTALYETPAGSTHAEGGRERQLKARKFLHAARAAGRTLLTEYESKRILALYGIPTVRTMVARTAAEAVTRARTIGFPVVLKLLSTTITHKRAAGGVCLGLRDVADVQRAWQQIKAAVTSKGSARDFLGVTVQPEVPREGCELILGSSIDEQVGPVILFGAGGEYVEVFQDYALGLPPLNATLARRLMEGTRVHALLEGRAGRPAADLAALAQLLVDFSQLVIEQPWIREIDVNPVRVSPAGIVALDARMVLHAADIPGPHLPRPAIRPYPEIYVTTGRLRDRTPVVIRPIRPDDEPMMVDFHHSLSERSVWYRYFSQHPLEQRIAHRRLARMCFVDYDREIALVAVYTEPVTQEQGIIGVARLCKEHAQPEGEFAVVISDPWQGRGLGSLLLRELIEVGRAEQLHRITGTILADNVEMRRLCTRVGFTLSPTCDGECTAELVL